MGRQVGEWPFYSIVMSAGQLLSASAFQLVLLSGTASQTDLDLYVIGAVFFTATIVWWSIFRTQPSSWGLSFPWLFFALAFFLIGLPSLHGPFTAVQTHLQAAATWCYAIASAAAFLFFGMNFGEEAGATTQSWIFRACVVQGLQQCWAAILWWWGSLLINNDPETYIAPRAILAVVWPLSIVSFLFFFALWFGLPQYYLQRPPTVPNFYATLFRRDIVRWFLVAEILRGRFRPVTPALISRAPVADPDLRSQTFGSRRPSAATGNSYGRTRASRSGPSLSSSSSSSSASGRLSS